MIEEKTATRIERFYSLLLRAYPERLRAEYGTEMRQLFSDQLNDARKRRDTGRFYARTLADWLRTVPAEHYLEHLRTGTKRPLTPVRHLLRRGLVFAPNPAAAVLITLGILAWGSLRRLQRGF